MSDMSDAEFWNQFDVEYGKNYWVRWRKRHPEGHKEYKERRRQQAAVQRREMKAEVLTHYGRGKLACVRCGFLDIRALCLDHINGGGTREREEIGIGVHLYRHLKKENYPEGYQTLCYNCNTIKAYEDGEYRGLKGGG